MFLASEGRIVVYAVVCMELMEEAIMKVDILTREYPPHVYGGAGVHVEELAKVLAERIDVTVRAFDATCANPRRRSTTDAARCV